MGRVKVTDVKVGVNPETGALSIHGKVDPKNALLLGLSREFNVGMKGVPEMIEYLESHLIAIDKIEPAGKPYLYKILYRAGAREGEILKEVQRKINKYLNTDQVLWVVNNMMGTTHLFFSYLLEREGTVKERMERLKKKEQKLKQEQERIRKRERVKVPKQLAAQMHDKVPALRQLNLWDKLMDGTKDALISEYETRESAIEYVNRKGEGINVKRDQAQMIRCIAELLHEKSQNSNPKAPDYYTGNSEGGPQKIQVQASTGWEQTIAPVLGLTFTEIAKKWAGVDRPSGKDQKTVKKILYDMAEKPEYRCLMLYTYKNQKSKKDVSLSSYLPLWTIYEVREGEQKTTGILLALNPVFRADIENSFFLPPNTRQIMDAYGRGRIPETVTRFIWEISRWQSIWSALKPGPTGNTRTQEIGQIRLFQKIAPEYMPPNKQKTSKIIEYFNRGVETAKKLGILADVKEREGADGGIVYLFDIIGEGRKTKKQIGRM